MQKNFETLPTNKGVTDEMLREINRYTRQPLTADDVFVFFRSPVRQRGRPRL